MVWTKLQSMVKGGVAVLRAGLVVGALACAAQALGQCPGRWLESTGYPNVIGDDTVMCATVWDPDGPGPKGEVVVVGGPLVGAGNVAAAGVAAWDGTQWQPLGEGFPGVRALTVYNGDLIAGGVGSVKRFDGTSWQPVGGTFTNPSAVWALTVYNGQLIASGLFSVAGGTPALNIAAWNGSAWQAMGSGIANGVLSLTVYNGELIAGGWGAKRWTGTSWAPMGTLTTGSVESFGVYNGELYAGGSFWTVGPRIARWNGTDWQGVGGGASDAVWAMCEYQGRLVLGGIFLQVGTVSTFKMAQWDGENWQPMAALTQVRALVRYGNDLIIVGSGQHASGWRSSYVLRWDGSQFYNMGDGFSSAVFATEEYGGDLYAGGEFGLARRDSAGEWHNIEFFGSVVWDMAVFEGSLLVATTDAGVFRWDGSSWSNFGSSQVADLFVHEGHLYGAGNFGPDVHVAQWDSESGSWMGLGTFTVPAAATCLTVHDGYLVAGGFSNTGNVWRRSLASPGAWEVLGQTLGNAVQTLGVYHGELYAGGYIDSQPGGGTLSRFNGTSWVPVGGGLFLGSDSTNDIASVFDMREYHGELIVAGSFTWAHAQENGPGAISTKNIAAWNGTSWRPLGAGVDNGDRASVSLSIYRGTLVVGGWFHMAGGRPAGYLAFWGVPSPDFDCDGSTGTDADIAAFFACIAGACPASPCGGRADFDGDGDVGTDADIEAFFRVLAGGSC